jgi:prepilin-type processing-associated H-X9-DG protein
MIMGEGGFEGRMIVQRIKGIAYTDVLVLIVVVVFLLVLGLTGTRYARTLGCKPVCGTNLKGLGTAMDVYANDYTGSFPQLPGTGPWSKKLGFAYDNTTPNFKESGEQHNVDRTITASWYLLVREADVSPKSFVCTSDKVIKPYDGKNPQIVDIVALWDFGTEPHKHVSYAMHNPYGAYSAGTKKPASFAIAADMSPWFRLGDFVKPDTRNKDWRKNFTLLPPYFSDTTITREKIQQSNALAHGREGQNVAFADGHSEYCKTTDVGVKHDNIYTYWSATENPTENNIRIGTNPTARDKDNDAKSADDSFLAI